MLYLIQNTVGSETHLPNVNHLNCEVIFYKVLRKTYFNYTFTVKYAKVAVQLMLEHNRSTRKKGTFVLRGPTPVYKSKKSLKCDNIQREKKICD